MSLEEVKANISAARDSLLSVLGTKLTDLDQHVEGLYDLIKQLSSDIPQEATDQLNAEVAKFQEVTAALSAAIDKAKTDDELPSPEDPTV